MNRGGGGVTVMAAQPVGGKSPQWQAQSKPHAPFFGIPPHVIPGGQVPHLQKLQVIPLSLGSPHGIDSPVHAHEVAPVAVQVVPDGQSGVGPPN